MVDRISTLPSDVLCNILSFLPTDEVVATCFVSKRWRQLWISVPSLDFDDLSYLKKDKPYSSFHKFVCTAILARDVQKPIRTFRLKCWSSHFDLSDSDVSVLVNAAMRRPIENLEISLVCRDTTVVNLRGCIFRCETLVALKLDGLNVNAFTSVHLPSLKTLHLRNVDFLEAKYFVEFLSGCPILEDFEARHIYHIGSGSGSGSSPGGEFKGSLPKLVRANIDDIDLDIPLKAICNAKFLCTDQCADNIPVFPNLTHMELAFHNNINWCLVLVMLQQCPKLQILVLHQFKHVTTSADVAFPYPSFVPECLSSHLRKCAITNYKGNESELRFAKYIMQSSAFLQAMTVCSLPYLTPPRKLEMIQELTLCSRRSASCELSFI